MRACVLLALAAPAAGARPAPDIFGSASALAEASAKTALCTIHGPPGGPEFEVDIAMEVPDRSSCETQCLIEKTQIFGGSMGGRGVEGTGVIYKSLVTSLVDGKCNCYQTGEAPLYVVRSAKTKEKCESVKSVKKCWESLQLLINYKVDRNLKIDYGNLGSFGVKECKACEGAACHDQIRGLHNLVMSSVQRMLVDVGEERESPVGSPAQSPQGLTAAREIKMLKQVLPEDMLIGLHLVEDEVQEDLTSGSLESPLSGVSGVPETARQVLSTEEEQDTEVPTDFLSSSDVDGSTPDSLPSLDVVVSTPDVLPSSDEVVKEGGSAEFCSNCIVYPNSGGDGWLYQLKGKKCLGNTLLIQLDRDHTDRLIAVRFDNLESQAGGEELRDAKISTTAVGDPVALGKAFGLKDVYVPGGSDGDSRYFASIEGSVSDGVHLLLSKAARTSVAGDTGDMMLSLIGSDIVNLGRSQDVRLTPTSSSSSSSSSSGVQWHRIEIEETHSEAASTLALILSLGMADDEFVTTSLREEARGFIPYLELGRVGAC